MARLFSVPVTGHDGEQARRGAGFFISGAPCSPRLFWLLLVRRLICQRPALISSAEIEEKESGSKPFSGAGK
jgi:hypothetical protein